MPTSPQADSPSPRHFTLPHLRWWICGLLFVGSTVNYIDRGTIAILAPHLGKLFNWSESDYGWIVFAFQISYAIMMPVSGGIIDWLGTRAGYALAMAWWSVAAASHAAARGVLSFGVARFLLGTGEAGNFPASIKAVAEWFPRKERALATGIFNSGTNIGAVIAYPLVGWLLAAFGWQMAFIATGGLGLVAVVLWYALYGAPHTHPWITPSELADVEDPGPSESPGPKERISWLRIFSYRQAWGFAAGKFMTDAVWWFYLFWLPKYLTQARGMSMTTMEAAGSVPFITAMVGSVAGGWLSGALVARGWNLSRARKTAMAACAFCMPAGIVAVYAHSPWTALALISLATSAHQGWSANLFTLVSDIFPKQYVGSVVGIGGAAGALGGAIFARVAGHTLQFLHGYAPLFIIAGILHPLALAVIHLLIPRIEPLES